MKEEDIKILDKLIRQEAEEFLKEAEPVLKEFEDEEQDKK